MNETPGRSFRLVMAAVVAACVLALLGGLALLAAGLVIEGGVVVAVTIFLFRMYWHASLRQRRLARLGYFAGRRVGSHWVYEELQDGAIAGIELPLDYVGRGEYVVHVPAVQDWRTSMPAWARERRDEIVGRLPFKRSQIHFDA